MKDLMLVDAGLSNKFWAESMDIELSEEQTRRLKTRQRDNSEEKWTGNRQDVSHLRIFDSTLSTHIPKEKRQKSDIKKIWKGILIRYTETTKHYRVYA